MNEMITKDEQGRSRFIEIQPGDMTRYEFMIMESRPGWVYIAGSLMTGYEFEKTSLKRAWSEVLENPAGGYCGYVAGHNRIDLDSAAKGWTARAMILAAVQVIQDWDAEAATVFNLGDAQDQADQIMERR